VRFKIRRLLQIHKCTDIIPSLKLTYISGEFSLHPPLEKLSGWMVEAPSTGAEGPRFKTQLEHGTF